MASTYYAAFIKRKTLKTGDDTSDVASVSSKKSGVSALSNGIISSPESDNITKAIVDNQGLMNKLRKETELRRQRQLEREESKRKEEEKRIEQELKKRKKLQQQVAIRNVNTKGDNENHLLPQITKQKVKFSVLDNNIPLNPPPKQEVMASTALFRVVEKLADRRSVNTTQVVEAIHNIEVKESKLSPRTLKALEILDFHDRKKMDSNSSPSKNDIDPPTNKHVRLSDISEPIMNKQLKFKLKPSKESDFGMDEVASRPIHHSPSKRIVKTNSGVQSIPLQQHPQLQQQQQTKEIGVLIKPRPTAIDYQFKILTNLNEEKELETKSDQPIRSKAVVRRPWREPVNIPDRRPQTALSKEISKLEDSIQKIDMQLKQKQGNPTERKMNNNSSTNKPVPLQSAIATNQPSSSKLPKLTNGKLNIQQEQPQPLPSSTPIRLTEEALRTQNHLYAQENKKSVFDMVQKMQVPEFSIRINSKRKGSLRNSVESMMSQVK